MGRSPHTFLTVLCRRSNLSTMKPIRFVYSAGKIVLLCMLAGGLFCFAFRDFISAFGVQYYLRQKFNREAKVEKASLSLTKLSLRDVSIVDKGINFLSPRADIYFSFCRGKIVISEISLDGAYLAGYNFKEVRKLFLAKFGRTNKPAVSSRPGIVLTLKNSMLHWREKGGLHFHCNFSFEGTWDQIKQADFKRLDVFSLSVQAKSIAVSNAQIKRVHNDTYAFVIPSLTIKERTVKNITIPFQYNQGKAVLVQANQLWLGQDAFVNGSIDFFDKKGIAFDFNFEDISLAALNKFVTKKDDIVMEGLFSGSLALVLKGGKPAAVTGEFFNKQGGFINVKKDDSLGFLRKGMDAFSYKAFIDNLKNYRYNKAVISIDDVDCDVNVKFLFDSEQMGQRELIISGHDVL